MESKESWVGSIAKHRRDAIRTFEGLLGIIRFDVEDLGSLNRGEMT